MPNVPEQCQGIADDVTLLEAQAQAVRSRAETESGAAAWADLAQLGLVLQQVARKRAELDACITANTGRLAGELVVMDVSGGAPPTGLIASLWDMSTTPPNHIANASVENNGFAFAGPLPSELIAVVVDDQGKPNAGPLFRSGPISAPAIGTTLRVEVVIGPTMTLTAAEVSKWFSTLASAPAPHINLAGIGSVDVQLSSVAAALEASRVTLVGVGTASGTMGLPESRLTARLSLGLVPSTAPDAISPVELTLADPPQLELVGPAAALAAAVDLALSSGLSSFVLAQMRDVVGREVAAATTRSLALVELPPSVTAWVRSLSIDPTGITFQPTLNCVGTALSTFKPGPSRIVSP